MTMEGLYGDDDEKKINYRTRVASTQYGKCKLVRLGGAPLEDNVPRCAADKDFDGQLGIQQRIHALTRRQPGR